MPELLEPAGPGGPAGPRGPSGPRGPGVPAFLDNSDSCRESWLILASNFFRRSAALGPRATFFLALPFFFPIFFFVLAFFLALDFFLVTFFLAPRAGAFLARFLAVFFATRFFVVFFLPRFFDLDFLLLEPL